MHARLTLAILTIITFTLACGHRTRAQSNASMTAATIEASCAPWDGPAFEVRMPLDSAAMPALRIAIWKSPNVPQPSEFRFPDTTQQVGVAHLLHEDGEFEPLSGTVSFGPVQVGQPVTGSVRLTRARGGALVERTFRATWVTRTYLCG